MADPGSVSDDLARAGCGSGHAWLLRPLGSRAPGAGPFVTSLARSAIRSPDLSPTVMSGGGPLRGVLRSRDLDRSRHHVIYGGAARRSYGRGPLGLRLGLCALPWRVAAHFCGLACRQSSRFAGVSCDGETRTRTGDTTIFSSYAFATTRLGWFRPSLPFAQTTTLPAQEGTGGRARRVPQPREAVA
jgi:hypothetical protein